MKQINESMSTPVTHTCDVLVAGGGFAGISAALAAAMTDDFTTIDIKALQSRLTANGVRLHESEL